MTIMNLQVRIRAATFSFSWPLEHQWCSGSLKLNSFWLRLGEMMTEKNKKLTGPEFFNVVLYAPRPFSQTLNNSWVSRLLWLSSICWNEMHYITPKLCHILAAWVAETNYPIAAKVRAKTAHKKEIDNFSPLELGRKWKGKIPVHTAVWTQRGL